MPESDSGQKRNRDAPEGWRAVELWGKIHYAPDPRHPLHPQNSPLQGRPIDKWLDREPEFQAFIVAFRKTWEQEIKPLDARIAATRTTARERAELQEALRNIMWSTSATLETIEPRDVTMPSKWRYIALKVFPQQADQILRQFSLIDFDLVADENGQIVMRFTGASANEREKWNPLIDKAQAFFQHRRNIGGRKKLEDDPEHRVQAIQAAELANSAAMSRLSRTQRLSKIASLTGLMKPGENAWDPAVMKRTERTIERGNRLKRDENPG